MVDDIKDRAEVLFKNKKEDKTQGIDLLAKEKIFQVLSQKWPISVILWSKKNYYGVLLII